MPVRKEFALMMVLIAVAPALSGCDEPTSAAASPAPVPQVSVITVKPEPRALIRELPGRIAPTRVAEVRPQVSGIIVERLFEQGSYVKAGDPLYKIDPRPFEVELQATEAALQKAEAVLEQTTQQAHRMATLVTERAVSKAANETAQAEMMQARADVAARKAEVERARLNLQYATIRAPISGVIGAARVSEGALVVQNDTTSLATVQQLDHVYADFTQPVSELNRLRRAFESGDLEKIAPDAAAVHLVLDDGTSYPIAGRLLFSDSSVDADTGQVTLRAEFKNPRKELLPGMYVRVSLKQGIDADALVVPDQAVQRTASGDSEVYVVKHDNRIIARPIRLGEQQGGQWLVASGLKPGDHVVVEGFQKFVVGDAVKPKAWVEAKTEATGSVADNADPTHARQ
ncbi:efflux RND transporter periplasmic adaptor subunit [Afipia sp. TerB]